MRRRSGSGTSGIFRGFTLGTASVFCHLLFDKPAEEHFPINLLAVLTVCSGNRKQGDLDQIGADHYVGTGDFMNGSEVPWK